MQHMRKTLLLLACLIYGLAGCTRPVDNPPSPKGSPDVGKTAAASQPDFREQLLDLSFGVASAIPVDPHVKDRCKIQEEVVDTCLELDQLGRACAFTEKIINYRRGSAYADLALYFARHKDADAAAQYVARAKVIADAQEDWRKDPMLIKIAQVKVCLGQLTSVDAEAGVENFEKGKLIGDLPVQTDEQFQETMKTLDGYLMSGKFDLIRNGLESGARLYSRLYPNQEWRSQIEEKVKSSWSKMPSFIQIDLLAELAQGAAAHGDKAKAIDLMNEARDLSNKSGGRPVDKISQGAKLVRLWTKVGEKERAQAEAQAALADWDKNLGLTLDIERARALLPMAEAYQNLGDIQAARKVYAQALDCAVINPNSRPRAEDLCGICLSMARCGVEPETGMWTRIRDICGRLGDPW